MSRPRLRTDTSALLPGLAAVALFAVMAAAFLNAQFPDPAGFGEDAAIVRSIGAALFNIDPELVVGDDGAPIASEGFLAAFILIAVLLDAALDGSIMLAKREDEGGDAR